MPRRNQFAVIARQRAIIHRELHLDRRRIDRHERQRHAILRIRNRLANEHLFEPSQSDDVAGVRFGNFDPLQPFEMKDRGDFRAALATVPMNTNRRVAQFDLAAVDLAESDSAQVIGIIKIGDQQLEPFASMRAGRRDVFDDRVEQRLHRAAGLLQIHFGETFLGAGVNDRKIHLLIRRVERHEQIPDLIQHFMRGCVFAIDLVDHHDRLGARFERFAQHEPRLRLWPFGGIDHEQDPVDHVHDALDFTAEISMAGMW